MKKLLTALTEDAKQDILDAEILIPSWSKLVTHSRHLRRVLPHWKPLNEMDS